jgi:hypothetical protein
MARKIRVGCPSFYVIFGLHRFSRTDVGEKKTPRGCSSHTPDNHLLGLESYAQWQYILGFVAACCVRCGSGYPGELVIMEFFSHRILAQLLAVRGLGKRARRELILHELLSRRLMHDGVA